MSVDSVNGVDWVEISYTLSAGDLSDFHPEDAIAECKLDSRLFVISGTCIRIASSNISIHVHVLPLVNRSRACNESIKI